MRHLAARWFVLVVAVAGAAGLGYRATLLEQRALDARRGLAAATIDVRTLQSALATTRRATAALVSPGQPAVSWSRQAASALDTVRARLASLGGVPGGAGLAASSERLDRLVEVEGRLREYAVGGRALMASDVAFGEALPHIDAIDEQVAGALAQMDRSAEQNLAATRDQQTMALAGAFGTLALAALILTPLARARADHAGPVASADPTADHGSLDLGRIAPAAAAVEDTPRPVARGLDLSPVAAVCGELARLSDGATLASVLERVAPALGARGLVVWLADADRRALQAAASWGYDARLVERFPSVPVTDDNPTARAYATGAPCIAPGRAGQSAAVAAPIVGSHGAAGVLSVELTASGGVSADVVAVAAIVAAQLATLLEPLPRSKTPATDAPHAQHG